MHRAAGQTLLPRGEGEASIERGVALRVPADGVSVVVRSVNGFIEAAVTLRS